MSKAEKSRIWDIILLKESGAWEGFRAPDSALKKTINYVVFLFVVAALSLFGWLWSRWELGLAQERLGHMSLELESLKTTLSAEEQGRFLGLGEGAIGELTFLPRLDSEKVSSEDLAVNELSIVYSPKNNAITVDFFLDKETKSSLDSERLYWILLLHGAQGLRAFPSAMNNRQGLWVTPQKGQLIENLRKSKRVNGRFRLQGFFEASGAEATYATLLLYDHKGSLLVKEREDVVLEQ